MTAGEARQLQRLRQAARRWRAALAPLAAAARSQGDGALQADLVRLDVILWQLAWAQQLTLASYAAALRASNDALTLWRTDAAYVGTGEQAWQEAGAGASELTTAADTGFVFGVDLGSGQTWSYAEGGAPGQGAAGEGDGGEGAAVDQGAPGDGAPGQGAAGEGAAGPAAGAAAATGAAGADHDIAMPEDAPEVGEIGDAALPAAGVAAEVSPVPGSGWIVIHGGAGAGLPAEALPVSAEPASPEADSAAALDDTAPLAWEEICRPWQPSAGGVAGLCVMSPSA